MTSFFNENYRTPTWLKKKLSRRHVLKSAAGASAIAALPAMAFNTTSTNEAFQLALKDTVWQTLDALFDHLFPVSKTGPSAQDIQATFYLYQLVHNQPTSEDEIDFIYRGVGWLNGFTQNKYSKKFITLNEDEKEQTLQAISQTEAGQNWLNMMILNLYEAMLSPPAYGGNPDGIGWEWLNHQAGFPLPPTGKRYYELPLGNLTVNKQANRMESTLLIAKFTSQPNKRNNKA